MAKYESRSFKDSKIVLDGNTYVSCAFENCLLVFGAAEPVKFIECTFGKDVSWSFAGAAALTLNFMASLYHGAGPGGQLLIERTFKHIRSGHSRKRAKDKELN
jgi:hypothetical protein